MRGAAAQGAAVRGAAGGRPLGGAQGHRDGRARPGPVLASLAVLATSAGCVLAGGVPAGAQSSVPSLAQLESLRDYSFVYDVNGTPFTGDVHSPSDWQEVKPFLERHIGGFVYVKLGPKWYKQKQGSNAYASSPYIGAARQYTGFLKVYGAHVVAKGPCRYAGVAGHIELITTSLSSRALSEVTGACIADRGRGMLAQWMSASGVELPSPAHKMSAYFYVTSVGHIPVLGVPSPLA